MAIEPFLLSNTAYTKHSIYSVSFISPYSPVGLILLFIPNLLTRKLRRHESGRCFSNTQQRVLHEGGIPKQLPEADHLTALPR